MRQLKEELVCVGCGSKYVVNKKYKLCQNCNYERTHQGKTQQQVQFEKNQKKQLSIRDSVRTGGRVKKDWRQIQSRQKNKKSLVRISEKNKYKCSDGSTVTQAEINFNYRETCNQIELEREPVCQGTGRKDLPLSFSHTISRSRCKKICKTELIWSKDNIEIESMGASDSAHIIWENGLLQEKKKLLNFESKLNFIKQNDPEGAIRYE